MSNHRRWQARHAFFRGTSDVKGWRNGGGGMKGSKKVKRARKKERKRASLFARGILKLNPFNFGGKKRGDKKAEATGDR